MIKLRGVNITPMQAIKGGFGEHHFLVILGCITLFQNNILLFPVPPGTEGRQYSERYNIGPSLRIPRASDRQIKSRPADDR